MCCYRDKSVEADLLKSFGRRKTLTVWKVIWDTGRAEYGDCRYAPGVHVAKNRKGAEWVGRYRPGVPCGIHVFLNEKGAREYQFDGSRVIPVVAHKDDFVRAGYGHHCNQAVFRRVTIRKRGWQEAMTGA